MKKTKKEKAFAQKLIVPTKGTFRLADIDASHLPGMGKKGDVSDALLETQEQLEQLQEKLYAQSQQAVLVVLQAMDTGGKDGTIRRVFGPLNPQGVRVTSFKAPTPDELAHDYLWRIHKAVPRKGMIGIFNRSHYEDVLIARVHRLAPKKEIDARYDQINAFERYLTENNVAVIKFYLHISKDEQKRRLQDRLAEPDKNWKFSAADLEERKLWDQYMKAFELTMNRCSTPWAPWYVIPANDKTRRDLAVARILAHVLKGLKLEFPAAEQGLEAITIDD